MLTLAVENHFEDWRAKARALLLACVSPDEVIWEEPGQSGLFPTGGSLPPPSKTQTPRVTESFFRSLKPFPTITRTRNGPYFTEHFGASRLVAKLIF